MIKVVTNSLGSGDWVVVRDTETREILFEGHRITPQDLVNIINLITFEESQYTELVEVTDGEI